MTIPNNQMVRKRVYCVDYHRNLQALHDKKNAADIYYDEHKQQKLKYSIRKMCICSS